MKLIRLIYTGYAFFIFSILFLLAFPFLLIPIIDKRRYNWVGVINRTWARLLFLLIFIPVRIRYESKLDPKEQYILCPNHFSYLDIPSTGLLNISTIFVGKSELQNIPLFGWMYRKIHIPVDRASLKSKYSTYVRSREAVNEGKSLTIYPEGGIMSNDPPRMTRFKDGAFRVAIETQIPIVPVTIINNWIILDSSFILRWDVNRIVVHSPIDTTGMTEEDMPRLKEMVAAPINKCLRSYYGDQ